LREICRKVIVICLCIRKSTLCVGLLRLMLLLLLLLRLLSLVGVVELFTLIKVLVWMIDHQLELAVWMGNLKMLSAGNLIMSIFYEANDLIYGSGSYTVCS